MYILNCDYPGRIILPQLRLLNLSFSNFSITLISNNCHILYHLAPDLQVEKYRCVTDIGGSRTV